MHTLRTPGFGLAAVMVGIPDGRNGGARLRLRLNTRSFVTRSAERDAPIPSLTSLANG